METKGPWILEDDSQPYIYDADRTPIAIVLNPAQVNGPLLTAAPALLAALRHMVQCHTPDANGQLGAVEECHDSLMRARAVIAEAQPNGR